jgi:HK97 gp10 family phage protein
MGDEAVRIDGLDEFKRKLSEVPKAMRKRVLRNALAAGAREVRDVAKRNAPVLTLGTSLKAPYRKPGTVKQAIRVRTSKADRRAGDVGVFVNVRPAKAGQRGAKNPNDPFYWRFLEFGTKKMPARPFLQRATSALPKALTIFQERIAKWINETNRSGQVIP